MAPRGRRQAATHELSALDGSGLRVVSEYVPGVRSVALGFWVGVGSRYEPAAKAGISHFIEHLLFRGTPSFDALSIAERFDAMGGELNAATSRETTVLYVRVPDEKLEPALDVMAEMVFQPTFADLETEREVVLEEIAMVDDTPQDLVHDLATEAVFGAHPLGRPVIGTAGAIGALGPRGLRTYHRSHYGPGNVVLAAAGNIRHGRLRALLGKRVRGAAASRVPGRRPVRRLPSPTLHFRRKETEQFHVCLAGPGVAMDDRRRYAASLLDAIVGGSASSRLFQEIREKRGMAYSVYSYSAQYADSGQVGIYVGTREENLEDCLDIVSAELAAIGNGGLSEPEVRRAKDNLRGRILLGLESTSTRMSRLGKAVVMGIELIPVEETIDRMEAVSTAELTELAAELYDTRRLSLAAIGPRVRTLRRAGDRFNPALAA